MNKIVLDLETKKTFEDVGGHHNSAQLGISLVGTYNYADNKYRAWRENEIPEMLQFLKAADLIIGFNSKHFDFTVLQPYYPKFDLSKLPHLDIMEEVVYALGHRLKLETIAQATLGRGKSGDGLDAIRYFQTGDWKSLEKYCLDDVRVTKEVYDYGASHGFIWYSNNGVKDKIIARWAQGETIEDLVRRAAAKGLQLDIEYIGDDGASSQHKIDIQSVSGHKLKAFSQTAQKTQMFDVAKIKSAREAGAMQSFQKKLF